MTNHEWYMWTKWLEAWRIMGHVIAHHMLTYLHPRRTFEL